MLRITDKWAHAKVEPTRGGSVRLKAAREASRSNVEYSRTKERVVRDA